MELLASRRPVVETVMVSKGGYLSGMLYNRFLIKIAIIIIISSNKNMNWSASGQRDTIFTSQKMGLGLDAKYGNFKTVFIIM